MTRERGPSRPSPATPTTGGWRLGKGLFVAALLTVFPLFLLGELARFTLDHVEQARRSAAHEQLREDLSRVAVQSEPKSFLQQAFSRFFREALAADNRKEFRHLGRMTGRHLGIEFAPFLFDGNGNLAEWLGETDIPRKIVVRLWAALQEPQHRQALPWAEPRKAAYVIPQKTTNRRLAEEFGLTPADVQNLTRLRGILFPTKAEGREEAWFWDREQGGQRYGVLIHCAGLPTQAELLGKVDRAAAGLVTELFHRSRTGALTRMRGTLPETVLERVWAGITTFTAEDSCTEGHLWAVVRAGDLDLVGGIPAAGLSLARERGWMRTAFAVFALGIATWLWFGFIRERRTFLSIRWKLILLFLFAVALPLGGMGFLGVAVLSSCRQLGITERFREAKEVLVSLDAGFQAEQATLLRLYRSLRDDPAMRQDMRGFSAGVNRLLEAGKLQQFSLWDVSGNAILDNLLDQGRAKEAEIQVALTRYLIQKSVPERVPLRSPSRLQKYDFLPDIMEDPSSGLMALINLPNQLTAFQFGDYRWLSFWDVFHDPTHPAAFVMITQSFQEFLRQYLEKRLAASQDPGFRGLRVLARATQSDHWFVPPDPTLSGLDHLLSRVGSLRQECAGRIRLAGEGGFALAVPGKYLENTTLLAIFTEREMDQMVGRWRMAVLIGMLLAFVIALVTGFVLSENILNPIAGLARGMAALEARDRQFRLPTGRRDEFGDLALSFNRVIEDLKEMELAQTFQESLLPDRLPAVPGFDLDRLHLRAARSFGDFLDVQPRPDGSVLLVLGDGTGSGIASGLLMAMVKALVFESAQEGGSLPDLMADLNRLMCDHLRRKELFSFLGAILEPSGGGAPSVAPAGGSPPRGDPSGGGAPRRAGSAFVALPDTHTSCVQSMAPAGGSPPRGDPSGGRLSFCNAGMPFPIRVSGDGQVEELRSVGFPLGFREEQAPFTPQEIVLAPGDGVVFLTNGLLKLPPLDGVQDAYADLRQRLGKRPRPPATELCGAIGDRIARMVPAEGPPDDVAILVVNRLPG